MPLAGIAGVVAAVAVGVWLLARPARGDAGARLYAEKCGYCHDVEGMIGVELDARVLRGYGNSRRLFDYIRLAMPYGAPRTLGEDEAWLMVEHLARSRGLIGPEVRVDGRTADTVRFR